MGQGELWVWPQWLWVWPQWLWVWPGGCGCGPSGCVPQGLLNPALVTGHCNLQMGLCAQRGCGTQGHRAHTAESPRGLSTAGGLPGGARGN